jgi:hypothetical protein
MTKRKYFSWTDEKREELREYIDAHEDIKVAFKEAALLFGVSEGSCYGAYKYEPKKPIVIEVDPEDLEPRKERVMTNRKTKEVSIKQLMEELKEPNTKTYKLKIDIHNDVNDECLVIHVNDSVTVIKVGDVILTLEV